MTFDKANKIKKDTRWELGAHVIFNDLGNWGVGRIAREGERGDSSRWFDLDVETTVGEGPKKPRRLVRADDLCAYSPSKWQQIADGLARLQQIDAERRAIKAQILDAFKADASDEELV